MTGPKVNMELLDRTMEWVEEQAKLPSENREWSQSDWGHVSSCGTTMCFAGKAAVLAGWHGTCVYEDSKDVLTLSWLSREPGVMMLDQSSRGVREVARKELGLTESEADMLFLSSESLETVRHTVADIRARARMEVVV